MRKLFTLLLLLFVGTVLNTAQASHIAGADLTFECVGQDSFEITLTMYRDCSGIPLSGTTRTVDISSSCFGSFFANLQLQNVGGTEVSQLCPDSLGLSQCVNGSNPYPGMQEFVFQGVVEMPSQCSDILISFDENARNSAVNAIVNPGSTQFYIETELNTVLFPCNNSPEFTSPPIPYVCQGQNVNYNYGIVESDGDSLVFSLVDALTLDFLGNPVSVPYNAGFSGAVPFPGISVNSATGELNFTPSQTGKFIVVLEVEEFNGIGQLISRTRRDIQFVVINCNNQVPQAPVGFTNFSGTADSLNPTTIEAEVGENFCIDITFTDPNPGDLLTVQSNVLAALPGATFNVSGTNPATATVCWTAFAGTNTNNVFNITVNDSACPVSGQNSQAFNVIVPQVPYVAGNLTTTDITCNGVCDGTASLNVLNGIGPFNVIWAPGSFGNVTSVGGLCPNAYNVIVQDLGDPDPSTNTWDTTFLIAPANPITTFLSGGITHDDCDPNNCTGAVTVLAAGGTGNLQYAWSDGPSGSSRTGLCAGMYTVSVTDDNNCTVTRDVRILSPAGVNGSINSITDVTCNGGNDGALSVNTTVNCGFTTGGCAAPITTQVGTGVNANSSNSYPAPYGDLNNSVRQQMLFTASELNALGIQEGRVTALDFNVALINGTQLYQDFTIQMGCTSLGSLTALDGFQTGLITVFEAKDIFISNGWNTHTFDNAFLWDGTSNVIVEWCFTNDLVAGGNSANSTSQYTTTAFPSVIYRADMLTSACGQATVDGESSNRPNVRFTHCGISYTYNWAPTPGAGQGTSSVSGLSAGNYSVTITSPDGCEETLTATVNQPAAVIANIAIDQPISCNGECDGEITASAVGGDGNFTFTWVGLPNGASQTGLCAGSYQVVATDGAGCTDTATINLTEPAVLQANISLVSGVSCNSVCDAELQGAATGGTAPYTFTWNTLPAGANATNVCAGAYELYVEDANGCRDTASITVTEPPVLSLTLNETSAISCNGVCDGEVTAAAAGGTVPYTISWPGGLTGNSQSGLCAGNYNVTVTDANGCTETSSITLSEPAAIQINLTVDNNISCFGVCDGELSVNPVGGAAPYTIQWPSNNSGTTETGLCAGQVTVTVTDANGCSNTESVTLSQPTEIVVTTSVSQAISCNGECDGEITVSANGGQPGYTYTWATLPNGATQSNLCAGTYTVTVTDISGCSQTENVVLNEPAPLSLSANLDVAILCGGSCSAQASVSSTGGTGNVTYTWTGPAFGPVSGSSQANLCAGTYTIIGVDANGCSDTTSLTISEPGILDLTLTQTQTINCFGECTAEVSASATGGVAPFTIQWPSGNSGTTESNLCAGTYNVTLTDANSCSTVESITISQPSALTATPQITSPISCNGVCDGEVTINVSGGTPVYSVAWPGGLTGATQTGLCSGSYDVTVTDANGCADTVSFNLTEPNAISLTLSETNPISCSGLCDGEITAVVSGGTAPVTVTWNQGLPNGLTQSNLCAGTYIATATGAAGCSISDTLIISAPTALTLSATVVDSISCNGVCDGILAAQATGGTLPYSYSWSNGLSGDTISGSCAGVVDVTVTDGAGCQTTAQISLTNPPEFEALIASTDSVSCFGGNDGSITADVNYISALTCGPSASACSGPLTNVNVGAGAFTNGMMNFPSVYGAAQGSAHHQIIYTAAELSAAGLSAGTISEISFNILDTRGVSALEGFAISMGCTSNNSLGGNWLGGLTPVYFNNVEFIANGVNTHVLSTPYNWDGSSNLIIDVCFINAAGIGSNPEMAATITTLPQVQYFASNTDVCANTTINPSTALQRPDISFGFCVDQNLPTNGSYSYAWSPAPATGQTGAVASNLPAGTYTVTITDLATGCSDTAVGTIFEPSQVVGTISVVNPISCSGVCDGELTASATGGTPGYSFAWSNGQNGPSISGLCSGTYTVTVTDNNGCSDTVSFNLSDPQSILVNTTILDGISCNGVCDGEISVAYSGGVAPYNVAWSNGSGQDTLTGLCQGQYVVTITDNQGCSVTDTVNLVEPAALSAGIGLVSQISCAGNCDGSIGAIVTGGTQPYSYNWSNSASGDTITGLCTGQYSVTVTDANGCTSVDTYNLLPGTVINLNANITDASCFDACDGSISVIPLSGVSPFSYQWSTGDTSNQLTNVCADQYFITVTDGNGCSAVDTLVVNEPSAIVIDTASTTEPTCGVADGAIDLSVTGGSGSYSYSWNGGTITGNPISNLLAGAYSVTVTDNLGCSDSTIIPLSNVGAIPVTTNATQILCAGDCNGEVSVAYPAGTYDIQWSTGNLADTTDTVQGLCAGVYIVTVSDASNGCIAVDTAEIFEPSPLVINNILISDANCGQSNGEVEVFATGGVPTYTYNWNGSPESNPYTGLSAGAYSLELVDANGCSVFDTVDVQDVGSIVADLQGVDALCFDSCNGSVSVSLTTAGSGSYTYNWSNSGSGSSQTGLCAGTYSVTVVDNVTGCSSADTVIIGEPAAIVVDSVLVTDANCGQADGEIQAFASGGTGGLDIVWNTTDTINPLSNIAAGNYLLEVVDANGCVVSQNVPVANIGGPSLAISTTPAGCNGECIGTATAAISGGSGSYSIAWSNGDTALTADSLCPGSYSLQVTDLVSGCISFDTLTIGGQGQVQIDFAITDNYNCSATTVCVGEVSVIPSGGVAPYSYNWAFPIADSTLSSLCAGTYVVTVTDANGCTGVDSAVVVDVPPMVLSDTTTNASCSNTNDGSIDLTVSGGIQPFTYSWTGPGFTANTEDVSNLIQGNYVVVVTDSTGCQISDTITLGVETILSVTAFDSNLCELVDSVWVGAQVNASDTFTVQWLNSNGLLIGDSTAVYVPVTNSSSTYTVVVNSNNCAATDSAVVSAGNIPDADAGVSDNILAGETVGIGGSPTTSMGGSSFSWSPSNGLNDPSLANPDATPLTTTTYSVTVTNIFGCSNSDTVTIFVTEDIDVPSGFSPNGDGVNDGWELDILSEYPDATVQIFNRWGQLVFESVGYKEPWDGKYEGEELPVGTYYYVIDLNNDAVLNEPLTGPVTLMR